MAEQKSNSELATELTIKVIDKGLISVSEVERTWVRFYETIQFRKPSTEIKETEQK